MHCQDTKMSKMKILFSGQTHTTVAQPAVSAMEHGGVDIRMSSADGTGTALEGVAPHPTAEQLFAGAWSACYSTALQLVAQQMKVAVPQDLSVDIRIDLGAKGPEWMLEAHMTVRAPGLDQSVADKVVHAAHEICPYSKAIKGNVDVAVDVVVA
jgi:lipoyl-dependent peroxiredoxin